VEQETSLWQLTITNGVPNISGVLAPIRTECEMQMFGLSNLFRTTMDEVGVTDSLTLMVTALFGSQKRL
jgi:hypothetical protein